jgi:hypothetical protein
MRFFNTSFLFGFCFSIVVFQVYLLSSNEIITGNVKWSKVLSLEGKKVNIVESKRKCDLLIVILTADKNLDRRSAQRETWLSVLNEYQTTHGWTIEYKYFLGRNHSESINSEQQTYLSLTCAKSLLCKF